MAATTAQFERAPATRPWFSRILPRRSAEISVARPRRPVKKPRARKRTRAWEIRAQGAINEVRTLTRCNAAGTARSPRRPEVLDHIRNELGAAEMYLDGKRGLVSWLLGTRVDGTWSNIHNARVAAIEVLDDDQLIAYSTRVLALADKYLTHDLEPHRRAISPWHKRRATPVSRTHRLALAAALRECYDRVGNEYHRLRRFQAIMVATTVMILLLVAGLVAVGWNWPQLVPMCFPDPTATVAQPAASAPPVCPTGPLGPLARADVAVVVGFGLLGSTLASVSLVVRRAAASVVPMGTTRWFQILLKAATGMLTAVLGLMFLRAEVVPGFSQVDTQAQILAYAVVFGASQELVTRFVDRRSNDLLKAVTPSEASSTPAARHPHEDRTRS